MITPSRWFARGKCSDKINASLRLEDLGVIVGNIDRRTKSAGFDPTECVRPPEFGAVYSPTFQGPEARAHWNPQ